MTQIIRASLCALTMLAAAVGPALAQGAAGQGPLFGMSPEGKATFRAAMRAVNGDGTQDQIQAVRTKELDLADAPSLDVGALAQAMQQERALVSGQQQRRQSAMLSAYQQLSPADRHVLVSNARLIQSRVAGMRAIRRGGAPVASAR